MEEAFDGFILGAGAMFLVMIITNFTCDKNLDATVGKQNCKHMSYVISIDSAATDSLYGKTWRNKK